MQNITQVTPEWLIKELATEALALQLEQRNIRGMWAVFGRFKKRKNAVSVDSDGEIYMVGYKEPDVLNQTKTEMRRGLWPVGFVAIEDTEEPGTKPGTKRTDFILTPCIPIPGVRELLHRVRDEILKWEKRAAKKRKRN
jgi:hypothetical protein